MEHLTKTQIVMLVLLVSFVTSLATGIVTVTLVNQAPQPITHTIGKVIEKVVSTEIIEKEVPVNTKVIVMDSEEKAIDVVKKVSPAVVRIVAEAKKSLSETSSEDKILIDEEKNDTTNSDDGNAKIAGGTGFFISSDGHILTSAESVRDPNFNYFIIKNDGTKLASVVLSASPYREIAVLKVEGSGFDFIPLGDSGLLNVGQSVIAMENTQEDFKNSIAIGIISGMAKSGDFFYTEAVKNLKGSGGPILDLSGKAAGIVVSLDKSATLGKAQAINLTKRDINDVMEFGEIKYPYLGINYRDTENGTMVAKGENGEEAVVKGGPADKAGIKEGDIILNVNVTQVKKENNLAAVLSAYRAGDNVEVKILRSGEEKTLKVVLETNDK
ncbi:MAG: PDZ domain-containing protein [bacterium]|nr:PDZ domain-containing protein [bacterium]